MQDPVTTIVQLGKKLQIAAEAFAGNRTANQESVAVKTMVKAMSEAVSENGWFTNESVITAVDSLAYMLRETAVKKWLSGYPELTGYRLTHPQKVLVIMAGNLPLVGFHDMLCVLCSGHHLLAKLSSQDRKLPVALMELFRETDPVWGERMTIIEGTTSHFNAVIATGSNNSSRYFDYYFGKYPHIIRKNRTSVAVLSGSETDVELRKLGVDVFTYFGLGCRNVSMIWVPQGYDFQSLLKAWEGYSTLSLHNKFRNNYEYQKAIMMVNRTPFIDNGFCLLKEDPAIHSPISVVHFQRYQNIDTAVESISSYIHELQSIVASPQTNLPPRLPDTHDATLDRASSDSSASDGSEIDISGTNRSATDNTKKEPNNRPLAPQFTTQPPGFSQQPELWDYADGLDTMRFLQQIS